MKYKKTVAVIDGDIIAFKAACAAETRSIKVTHNPSGREKVYKNRTEFKGAIDLEKYPLEDFTIEDQQEAEPLPFALHTVKCLINTAIDLCEADEYEIYLSGHPNFRDLLPLPDKYKGNRDGLIKPLLLPDIKDYLKRVHGAVECFGEADDWLAIRAYETANGGDIKYIAYTIDKDTYGCAGWFLNPDKMEEPFWVEGLGKLYIRDKKVRGYGFKWEALQWLVGDTVDGIKPSRLAGVRFGEKTAFKLLDPLETEDDIYRLVFDTYKKWYPVPVNYVDQTGKERTMDYIALAECYYKAIHMLRWEGEKVQIRETAKRLGYE